MIVLITSLLTHFRCPPIPTLSPNITIRLSVNVEVDLEAFLVKYYSNYTSPPTKDVIYTLGGHVRFESDKGPPQSMNVMPDHVYSSTVFTARRVTNAQVLVTVIVVCALALVFVRYYSICTLVYDGVQIIFNG